MKLIQFGVRNDYGKEWYLALFLTERYSLLQVAIDYGEYGKWIEPPYIQISSGYGRLFSLLFTVSKFGFAADFCTRNWRDELFYVQKDELV